MNLTDQTNFQVFSDGGSRGNPGAAAYGWLLYSAKGELLNFDSQFMGIATNNSAEYNGIAAALKYLARAQTAGKLRVETVSCYLDSELVVKQLRGEYKIKNQDLLPLSLQIQAAVAKLGEVEFMHIPREQNKLADRLVNIALDNYQLIKSNNL